MRSIKIADIVEITVRDDGTVDEIFINSNGECLFHMEQMDDNHYWAAAYAGVMGIHMDFSSEKPIIVTPRSDEAEEQ